MGLRASTTVTSGSISGAASKTVAAASCDEESVFATFLRELLSFRNGSGRGTSRCEGIGTPVAELSPANGVPTPPPAGFLGTGFPSGRDLESSMVPIQQRPEYRGRRTSLHTRARAGTGQCKKYI